MALSDFQHKGVAHLAEASWFSGKMCIWQMLELSLPRMHNFLFLNGESSIIIFRNKQTDLSMNGNYYKWKVEYGRKN